MTSRSSADHSGIPRGSFGLHTALQLSPRQGYALPAAPYQDFSAQVRRWSNPEWNQPRRPEGMGRSA